MTFALAFSVVLNVLVLATVVWPAWLESRLKFACALTAAGLWIAALWETRGELRRLAAEREARESDEPIEPPKNQDIGEDLLRSAQVSYLRGDWIAAERDLRRAIRRDADDFEARFWLVSVLRRAGRTGQAERLLQRVESRDAARGWRTEVRDERRRLTESLRPSDNGPTILPIRDTGATEADEIPKNSAQEAA